MPVITDFTLIFREFVLAAVGLRFTSVLFVFCYLLIIKFKSWPSEPAWAWARNNY